MNNTTLVIMAAGIGSRFGQGVKQLAPVGPNGEIIMDYSIYDAIAAGFNKVVFIIRKDIEAEFKEVIGDRISKQVAVQYVYQSLDALPEGYSVPEGRTKPFGTGQAVLCCKDVINEPFAVINADDYYGKEGFVKIHDYLVGPDSKKGSYCMAGFILGNTLSDNGSVTRGVCTVNADGCLEKVTETFEIYRTPEGAGYSDGKGGLIPIDVNAHVSMNMWGFTPDILDTLQEGFIRFLDGLKPEDLKAEYLLPTVVDQATHSGNATVKVLESRDKWFGVTYSEDKPVVVASIAKLIADGVYPENLY